MFFMSKFYNLIRILLLVLILTGMILHLLNVKQENARLEEQRAAQAYCVGYGFPQAVVVKGQVFCWAVVDGSDLLMPLDFFEQPSPSDPFGT
jgi:hypothetical protein